MSTPRGHITRVRFAGLRTAASVELDLGGLTVLIGPNGVGKSSLIEGFELLRRVMTSDDFVRSLHEDHGGLTSLITHGESELKLGVDLTTEDGSFSYGMVLGRVEGGFGIAHESLHGSDMVFVRTGDSVVSANSPGVTLSLTRPREPFLHLSSMQAPTGRVGALLEGIEVHGPLATSAAWLSRGPSAERSARSDNVVQATSRLARGGRTRESTEPRLQ